MLFLGIESSCDETAVAIIHNDRIIGHQVHRQDHRAPALFRHPPRLRLASRPNLWIKDGKGRYLNKLKTASSILVLILTDYLLISRQDDIVS